jgi:hypothetical protein
MTDGRVASHEHQIGRERVLAVQLTAAILCEN